MTKLLCRLTVHATLVFLPGVCVAQRLPAGVTPQHYDLTLTPDLANATFTGDETITVALAAPSSTVTLNAAEITFASVTAKAGASEQTASVAEDKAKEQATFTFPQPLPAGMVSLHIRYSGILNGQLRGFYLSKTAKRSYAVTQFEPTDARRAFPSFDEPALKATYNVALVIDKADTAISNTNMVSDKPGPVAGKHIVSFARTPKMSTYLVAFLVGDFVCSKGESDGVPIRACATPDKLPLTPYAVKAAEFILHYYDNYFGIKYPMPKLDMVAIPDFEAGAMENFGCITYRETDFLVDEAHGSDAQKQGVAEVVAHEMAHQWFGDMVTMQWWNNLWLNEGFATWMQQKPVAAWHPEWNIPDQVASSLNATLNLDAQPVTRAIRAEANTPDEINEMFDGITYQKGGAILGMVESYLGPEVFRKGVHNYLEAHLFANATAEDFWNQQTATSGKPVDKIMESFIGQPGVPELLFQTPAAGKVQVSQKRFYLSPSVAQSHAGDSAQSWTVPVCFKGGSTTDCPLLTPTSSSLPAPSQTPFFANARGKGYYRSRYPEAVQKELVASVNSLTAPEQINFMGDTWALVRSGHGSIGESLSLAEATRNDASSAVLSTALTQLLAVGDRLIATPAEREAFQAWVRATWKPALDALGDPKPGEAPEMTKRRDVLFSIVGGVGDDPATIARARTVTQEFLAHPDSVDPNLAGVASSVAAVHGDTALFDQYQQVYEHSSNPQISEAALARLGQFQDPALVDRALAFATSGKVKNQDSLFILAGTLSHPATRDTAWQYITTHWPAVSGQLTEMNGGAIVSAAGSFCSAEKAAEVKQFYTDHPVHAAARAMSRAQSSIKDCMEFRSAQESNLQTWLKSH